jgi:hypothetical protein
MAEEFDVGKQVTAIVAEVTTLREVCASQKIEIENLYAKSEFIAKDNKILRDLREYYEKRIPEKDDKILALNVHIDSWKADCDLYRESLGKLRKENEELKAKNDADNQRLCSVEAELSRRDAQVTKLIAILRRKITTNRVMHTALKAAFKVLPDLKHQTTLARVLELSHNAPRKVGIQQELSDALKEAGLVVDWDKPVMQSPAQTPDKKKPNIAAFDGANPQLLTFA